jgi:hypothetical protein
VHDLDACQSDGGGAEGFEPEHYFEDPFNRSVVLLDDVIQVFVLPQLDVNSIFKTYIRLRKYLSPLERPSPSGTR